MELHKSRVPNSARLHLPASCLLPCGGQTFQKGIASNRMTVAHPLIVPNTVPNTPRLSSGLERGQTN